MPEKIEFIVPEESSALRLDQCIARCVEQLSRRSARVVIDLGGVFVNNRRVKVAGRKVSAGQVVQIHLGNVFARATKKTGNDARGRDEAGLPKPQVLHEDEHLLVAFKPSGLHSVPTPESDRGNLLSVLSDKQPRRLLVVHRLDLETSGVLVFAKSGASNRSLAELFRRHDIERTYDVFVAGAYPNASSTLTQPLHGKRAVTHITRQQQGARASHLFAALETGRTHQIRLHLAGHGYPVLGDRRYGVPSSCEPPRMALHARLLAFKHPITGRSLRVEQDLPQELAEWWRGELDARSPADG